MTSIRSNRLVNLEQAKEIFRQTLQPRVDEYEARLKKNPFVRFFAYFEDFYGEKGYLRTCAFLNEMENANTTEEIIQLVQEKRYEEGTNMPLLLKKAVVLACGVAQRHLDLILSEVKHKIVSEYGLYSGLSLLQADEVALNEIYEDIIKSTDYGNQYLKRLDDELEKIERRQIKMSEPNNSIEMGVYVRKTR